MRGDLQTIQATGPLQQTVGHGRFSMRMAQARLCIALLAPATGELLDGVQDIESSWNADTYNADFVTRGDGVVLQENHSSVAVPSNLTDYTYDHIGNMLRRTNEVSNIGMDFALNAASQLTGFEDFPATTPPETISAALPHNVVTDRNSNIKRVTLDDFASYVEFRYDADNRLVEVVYPDGGPVIELAYDGLGRCARTRVNGAGMVHVYDGHQRVQDRDEKTGELVAEYTYLQGQLHKWRKGGVDHWVYIEPQGGWPRHIFDDAGDITDSFDFDWQGHELLHQGTTEVPIGWAGGWKLATDTDLPILLMPGTNEIWCPILGKSLNPLVSMSSALPLTTAIGGYTGELIGLPAKLPAIPAWGSAPGYPWWPGSQGPGGPVQMQDNGGSIGAGGGFTGGSGGSIGFKPPKTPRGCPPPPNWQTPCDCCEEELCGGSPGYPGPTCEAFNQNPNSDEWQWYLPSVKPSPNAPDVPVKRPPGAGKPTYQDCSDCFGIALDVARLKMNSLTNCLPSELWDCMANSLATIGIGGPNAFCTWQKQYYGTYACTICTYAGSWLNCSMGRHKTELAQTLIHEMIHWCMGCKTPNNGGCSPSVWGAITSCMVLLCAYQCNGWFTWGDHLRHCNALRATCSGLVIGCGWWSCNAYHYQTAIGHSVDIWGTRPVPTHPFECWVFRSG